MMSGDEGGDPISSCDGCGGHVTRDFRRVFGDNDNRVNRCPECAPMSGLNRGVAAGVPVGGETS